MMNNLITKINHWADSRGLKQADPKIQWMRVTEEVGEIRDVLLKPTKFTEPQEGKMVNGTFVKEEDLQDDCLGIV